MPNMWSSNGTPCYDTSEGSYAQEDPYFDGGYQGHPKWSWHTPYHGYRAHLPTPAEDFARPYVEDEEDPDGWDLI